LILSVDIGTSGCRAALFLPDGSLVSIAERPYPSRYVQTAGFAEQDPEEILRVFVSAVQQATAGRGQEISRVVIAAVLHSLILVDASGAPLTPMSTWADTRAVDECHGLESEFNGGGWQTSTGCLLSPALPLARLLWYRRHHKSLYGRFVRALSIKSYILGRIFGVFVEDHALASASGLLNLSTRQWDRPILDCLGIAVERLPEPVAVEQTLPDAYTSFGCAIGISPRATWIIGSGDGQMAHLGTAGYHPDAISMSIGTSCAVRTLATVDDAGRRDSVWTCVLDDKHCLSGMASNNGGNVLDWYLRKLLDYAPEWSVLETELADRSFDSGLFFLPYLFAERLATVGSKPASGFSGVRGSHTRSDLIRAILEGIAFHACRMALGLTYRDSNPVTLSGSLTSSPLVQQIIAATLAVPVTASARPHAPLYGSLRLLGVSLPEASELSPHGAGDGYRSKFAAWCDRCDADTGSEQCLD
jgi:gluconokinase